MLQMTHLEKSLRFSYLKIVFFVVSSKTKGVELQKILCHELKLVYTRYKSLWRLYFSLFILNFLLFCRFYRPSFVAWQFKMDFLQCYQLFMRILMHKHSLSCFQELMLLLISRRKRMYRSKGKRRSFGRWTP